MTATQRSYSQKSGLFQPSVQSSAHAQSILNYLPGNKIPTFEEQLQIDQRKQQLLNKRQFNMIQNLKVAKSNYKKKSASMSGQMLPGQSKYKPDGVGIISSVFDSQNNFSSVYRPSDRQSQLGEAESVTSSYNTDLNTQNIKGSLKRHTHLRMPDYSLAYSASGTLKPRRMVQSKAVPMHRFGEANDADSGQEDTPQTCIDYSQRWPHTKNSSQIDTLANTQSIQNNQQNSRYATKSHNREISSGEIIKKIPTTNRSLITNSMSALERRQAINTLQENARRFNSTSLQVIKNLPQKIDNEEYQYQMSNKNLLLMKQSKDVRANTLYSTNQSLSINKFPHIKIGQNQVTQVESGNDDYPNRISNDEKRQRSQSFIMAQTSQITVESKRSILRKTGFNDNKTIKQTSQEKRQVQLTTSNTTLQVQLQVRGRDRTQTIGMQKRFQHQTDMNQTYERVYKNEQENQESYGRYLSTEPVKIVDDSDDSNNDEQQAQTSGQQAGAGKIVAVNQISSKGQDQQSVQTKSTTLAVAVAAACGNGPQESESAKDNQTTVDGPSTKKFKVLASLMGKDLEKQYKKHFNDPNNKIQNLRLKKEFEKTYKKKTNSIRQGLKPIRFRDTSQPMGQLPSSPVVGNQDSKEELQKEEESEDISYATSSEMSSLPEQLNSSFSDESQYLSSTESQREDDVFKQTKPHIHKQRRSKSLKRKNDSKKNKHPILPKGMTKGTLYDDDLFQKWLNECFRPPKMSKDEIVLKQMAKNARKARRKRDYEERKQKKDKDKYSQSYMTDSSIDQIEESHNSFSSDSISDESELKILSRRQKTKKVKGRKTAKAFEEALYKKKNYNLDKALEQPSLALQRIESDEELRDYKNVERLIQQVNTESEEFTLNLSQPVQEILQFFKVTIVGSHDKRKAKRIRLLTHFMRQFFKFIKLEKEWAHDIKANDMGHSQKKIYEDCLARKEKDLLSDIKLMGEQGLEALQKRQKYKIVTRLMDAEEEQADQELLEEKGKALHELLTIKGPTKKTLEFQKQLQPQNNLIDVKLGPHKNDSVSPQRNYRSSHYGQALIGELHTSDYKKQQIAKSLQRRGGLGVGGVTSVATLSLIRTNSVMGKLQATAALLNPSIYLTRPNSGMVTPKNADASLENFTQAQIDKMQREKEIKLKLEVADDLEVFQKSKRLEEYYSSLRTKQSHENDRDTAINTEYSNFCIGNQHVNDLPVFTRIKNNALTLTDYRLNSGICKGLGIYLAGSNWRIDKSFLLTELVLDNNGMTDEDFAEILGGIAVQGQLKQISYARNSFGVESINQIEKIITEQVDKKVTAHLQLSQIRLIKIKTSPEVLTFLFTQCFVKMQNLTQLKLQGVFLGTNETIEELMLGLEKHKERLELLDLQDTQLTNSQLQRVTEDLKEFKVIHSIDFSYNSVRDATETLVSNLCSLVTSLSKLNHLSLSYMSFDFKTCQSIVLAVTKSKSLCSIHLSGNKLNLNQQKFLLRILGIREHELNTHEDTTTRINNDEVKRILKKGPERDNQSVHSQKRRRNAFQKKHVMDNDTVEHAVEDNKKILQNLNNFFDNSFPTQQIVNSYASKDNTERITKMKSQQDAQSYNSTALNCLVFTRQVYNPELFFNQDKNREDVQHDLNGPFNWHVNFKTDGCYICQQHRYCILFFSRKQVIEGNFFSSVKNEQSRIILDKICGFSATSRVQDHKDQPWLVGSFTQLCKSQFVPIADYTSLLKWRLKKSKFLKASKKVQNSLKAKIGNIFGGMTITQPIQPEPTVDDVVNKASKTVSDAVRRKSRLFTVAQIHSHLNVSKQSLVEGDESSDFSVDNQSSLLEIIQKLKKVDPETLILNFSASENPDLASDDQKSSHSSLAVDDVDEEDDQLQEMRKQRQDFFVFAAFVPPGKHMLLLRDVGTKMYRKNAQKDQMDHLKLRSPILQSQETSEINTDQDSERESNNDYGNGNGMYLNKGIQKKLAQAKSFNLISSESPQDSAASSLLRLNVTREDVSEYYYKELLVEPRVNFVMKTYSKPFVKEQVAKKQFQKEKSTKDMLQKMGQQNLNVIREQNGGQTIVERQGVFRDWIDESQNIRKKFFDQEIYSKINLGNKPKKSSNQITLMKQQMSGITINRDDKKEEPKIDIPFASLKTQANSVKHLLWDHFQEIREFYFEIAALDRFSYPIVNMSSFAQICLSQGKGYLKAILKPNPEPAKPQSSPSRGQSRSRQKRGSTSAGVSPSKAKGAAASQKKIKTEPQEELNKELYSVDVCKTACKVLISNRSYTLIEGERKPNQSDTLMVELVGFMAHLLKISMIWARGDPKGLENLPLILKKIISEDIPLMRKTISVQNKMIQQTYQDVELPYQIEQFHDDQFANLRALFSHNYRQIALFQSPSVDRVLSIYQKVLMNIFMLLSSKSTQNIEFESCILIQKSLPVTSFRIPKNKPTKRVLLKRLIQTVITAAATTEAGNDPAKTILSFQPLKNGVLSLESVQLCFSKAKILGSVELNQIQQELRNKLSQPPLNQMSKHRTEALTTLDKRTLTREPLKPHQMTKKIDYKRLNFVEWLEFMCRLASCTFVVDSKTASKTKNSAILRLIEDSKKPVHIQLASFLSVFLKQLVIRHCTHLKVSNRLQEQDEAELQEIYDQIPDLDELLEELDQA